MSEGKERYHILWLLNCTQLLEYDEALAKKDEENHALRERVLKPTRNQGAKHSPAKARG